MKIIYIVLEISNLFADSLV